MSEELKPRDCLPLINENDKSWLSDNPNAGDLVDYVQEYALQAIDKWNRRAQPAAPSDEVAAVLRYCRAVQQEGTVNERVVAQTVARMLVQPEAAEPKGADGLPVSAPRLYADEEPPGHADHVPKARNLFDAAPPVAPEPVVHCWSVSVDGRFLFHSANLHDARLRLDGDFVWDDDRLAFAKEVIAKLNAAHPPRAPLTEFADEMKAAASFIFSGTLSKEVRDVIEWYDACIRAKGINEGAAK